MRPSVHASAVLIGAKAVLIRGPSGSGKSRLARALIETAMVQRPGFASLVADDRVVLEPVHGRLLARAPASLAGLIEVHGLGIRPIPHEPLALVGLVVDLAAADAARMPDEDARSVTLHGVTLPRLPIAAGTDAVPLVLGECRWIRLDFAPVAAAH